jgi:pimeloyl-ACP methyl ester carboxylesterase
MFHCNLLNWKRDGRFLPSSGNHSPSMESDSSRLPLILLHGLAGSSRWWCRNVSQLAATFDVYAPDLIRFGQRQNRRGFDINYVADTLVQWMDWVGLKQAHVVGHSMGGYIAIDMAARFPTYVDRLVLVSAAVRASAPQPSDMAAARQLNTRWLTTLPLILQDLWYWRPGDILAAARTMIQTNVQERLRSIIAPSLVIWGEHDPMVPIAQGYRLAQELPCEELVVIESAGHHPMWEQPEPFNREVVDFLHRPSRLVHQAQPPLSQAA